MKFIVSLDYKKFTFDSIEGAGTFACIAKRHSDHENLSVEIRVEDDSEADDQED